MRLLTRSAVLAAAGLLAACQTQQRIEVPVPVEVPGPTRYVPVPDELTRCEDAGPYPPKGAATGELLRWAQRARAAAVDCQAKLQQIRHLGAQEPAPAR